jgi:acyl-CoA synthetase (AMP-forming)/AMP-acid ligase II
MEWYYILIYGILIIGAVSSYLNYRLQKKWFELTHPNHAEEKTPYKVEPSVSEKKI